MARLKDSNQIQEWQMEGQLPMYSVPQSLCKCKRTARLDPSAKHTLAEILLARQAAKMLHHL